MTNDEDRNALIPLPSGAIVKAGTGFKRILSVMVTDALDVARSRDKSLALARFQIGNYEFRDPDYRQILLWAEALKLEPAVVVRHLESSRCTRDEFMFIGDAAKVGFIVEDGAIATLAWDFKLLPITEFEWVDGLQIREMALYGAAAARLSLRLPLLNRLFCSGVAELDLSNVPALNCIECGDSPLTELDLSNVPGLTHLNVCMTQLVELDLSNVPALVKLRCENNRLTRLDLSHVPALVELWCGDNHLTELDLSNVPGLTHLNFCMTHLVELDLSHVPALVELWCDSNQLAELDLSHVPALVTLWCCDNGRFSELDLSSNSRAYRPFLRSQSAHQTRPVESPGASPPRLQSQPNHQTQSVECPGAYPSQLLQQPTHRTRHSSSEEAEPLGARPIGQAEETPYPTPQK